MLLDHFFKGQFPFNKKTAVWSIWERSRSLLNAGVGIEREEAGCHCAPYERQQQIWQVSQIQFQERRQDSKCGSGNSSSPPVQLFWFAHEKTSSPYRSQEPQAGRRRQTFPSLLHARTVLSRVPNTCLIKVAIIVQENPSPPENPTTLPNCTSLWKNKTKQTF